MMQTGPAEPQVTSLFSNAVLNRLERLRISATRRFTNKSRGEHLYGKGGASTEFSDYRDYAPGDDVRFVDWNIFARLNRPYMKIYEQEEELHVTVLVDASASMGFEGKLDLARRIGAAYAVMGLVGRERVSVYSFNAAGQSPPRLPPCTRRANMARLFSHVEGIQSGGDAPVETGVDAFLKHHVGRGIAVLVSDFLTFGDLRRALNSIFSAGLEVFAVQILAPMEIDPELAGDLRLVDSETANTLDVSNTRELLRIYRDCREAFEARLASLCQQRGGRFVRVSSEDPLDWILFDLMRRRGWVR